MQIKNLHKAWNFFWNSIGIIIASVILIASIAYGVVQLPSSKAWLVQNIEDNFNEGRTSRLEIGRLSGHLPFSVVFEDVALYSDSTRTEAIIISDTVSAGLDVAGLLNRQFLVTNLEIFNPDMEFDFQQNDLSNLFRKIDPDTTIFDDNPLDEPLELAYSVLVPRIKIYNGNLRLFGLDIDNESLFPTSTVSLTEINSDIFIEVSSEQRFLDIEQLSFKVPEADVTRVNIFGQIFNDDENLEFNAFSVNSATTGFKFSSEVKGVNLLQANLKEQFKSAQFSANINELIISGKNLNRIVPAFPPIDETLYTSVSANGSIDSLTVDDIFLVVGDSELKGYGGIHLLSNSDSFSYSGFLNRMVADSANFTTWFPSLNELQLEAITNSEIRGSFTGTDTWVAGDLQIQNPRGNANLEGKVGITDDQEFDIKLDFENLNLGGLFAAQFEQTSLTGTLATNSNSIDPKKASGNFEMYLSDGSINAFSFDTLFVEANWENGLIMPEYGLSSAITELSGQSSINLADSVPSVTFTGSADQFDIKALTNAENLSKALVDMEYDMLINGFDPESAFGRITIDLPQTIINEDTLRVHQIYADYNALGKNEKSFRLTSTALDLSLDGMFALNELNTLGKYWISYLSRQVNQEILFNNVERKTIAPSDSISQNLTLNMTVKDVDLLRKYIPKVPNLSSKLAVRSDISMNNQRLLFNATVTDSTMKFNEYELDSLSMQVTGNFRAGELFRESAGVQLAATAKSFSTEMLSGNDLEYSLRMDEDSVFIRTDIAQIGSETNFDFQGNALLTDSVIAMQILDFSLGSESYQWNSVGVPKLAYAENGSLIFNEFQFENTEEYFRLQGVFSDQAEDSVQYTIQNVNLGRVSDIIDGRINFSGTLNANFTTRSLTRIPTIQGFLGVTAFAVDDNVVGDVNLNSRFNQQLNRFDTRITVQTDSLLYPEYFTRSERAGQNIELDGYVLAPEGGNIPEADSLFYFDLNFESVDLWVLPFIAPKVFTEMSGVASGQGSIWGNLDDFDYSVDYDIGMEDAVYFRPRFLETFYYGQGSITFDRTDGLTFHDVFIIDPSGGRASLNGIYDLGNFEPIHQMNLILEMDEFQFLNNDFDPDVAFFGDAYGSATVRMTGTNLNPVLTTESPVLISDFSQIGIPLLEETEFDEDNKFIRFVDTFDFDQNRINNQNNATENGDSGEEENPFDATFIERFTLDLQFIATNAMEVQLIFDPITGDQIEAEGTGRLGIRLEDEQLSMFGQFDITGGSYQFVSGEIFTRRFELEPGGTITWEGPPADARLDLNAIYEARPDINTLTQARSDLDSETSQRVPVELVLNVGGSLTSIENNFYFRLPNNFETRQNSTLNTQIAALNRNEDEKLIQAASFLLMGDFIPTASNDATNTFATNISGSGAVLNPLLSSQVISPLLSSQINSLLRSDIGSLDIDFNLNTYNNVDLGVALRLYNDRIILSREGQITGAQSNIGDIGATYRINNTLSVTAFHRQDPTFSGISGGDDTQQSQDINGVGVEAEVSFNSWQEFFRRLTKPFRKLFGRSKDNEEIATTE